MTKVKGKTPLTKKRKVPIILIIVACVVAAALIFGAVLGIIAIVKRSRAVVSYGGVTMDKGEAAFFVSRYKVSHISSLRAKGIAAEDTAEFWASAAEDGVSYGERLNDGAVLYLKEIVVGCYLFDRYASLTGDDRDAISRAVTEVIEYHADGDRDKFEAEAEKLGFDYSDFTDATTMLYKANKAFAAIYGEDGSAISSDATACAEYLNEYSHVKLLFIRTEEKMTKDEEGREVFTPLTDEEKAERFAVIEKIKGAIDAKDGEDGQMTQTAFESFLQKHGEGDATMDSLGYYFHPNAEMTAEFAEAFPTVVERALAMEKGEFDYAETAVQDEELEGFDGFCFIYKYDASAGAYASDELEIWFSDFLWDASVASFTEAMDELIAAADEGKRILEVDAVNIPMNTVFAPKF